MKKFDYRCILILLAALWSLSACEHKELCYEYPHVASVYVDFDWRDAPDARPAGMCVIFYPADGEGRARRYDFQGTTGGQIDIPVGRYRALCYNNDTETVLFDGTDDFYTYEAFTREGSIFESIYGSTAARAPRADDQRVVISPDMMWGCTATEVEIDEQGVSYVCLPLDEAEEAQPQATHTRQLITLYPHELVCTYTYEIRHVKGLERASQMCGTLSGMAPSLLLSSETLDDESVTLPFAASFANDSTVAGRFLTFGHSPTNPQPHRMLLYVWMRDGSRFCYGTEGGKFDVTGQVHSAPDKRHVHLVIDGLDLPQPIGDDGNFDASTDDWLEINEDIHL